MSAIAVGLSILALVVAIAALIVGLIILFRPSARISPTPSDTTVLSGSDTVSRIATTSAAAAAAVISNDGTTTSTTSAWSSNVTNNKIREVTGPAAEAIWTQHREELVADITRIPTFYPSVAAQLVGNQQFTTAVANAMLQQSDAISAAVNTVLVTDGVPQIRTSIISPLQGTDVTIGGNVKVANLEAENLTATGNVTIPNLAIENITAQTIEATRSILTPSIAARTGALVVPTAMNIDGVATVNNRLNKGPNGLIDATRLLPVPNPSVYANTGTVGGSGSPSSIYAHFVPPCDPSGANMGTAGMTLRFFTNTNGVTQQGLPQYSAEYPIRNGILDLTPLPYRYDQSRNALQNLSANNFNNQIFTYYNGAYNVGTSSRLWSTRTSATATTKREQRTSDSVTTCIS